MSCDHRKYPLPPLHAIVAYNIVQSAAIYQEPLTLFPFHWIPRPLCIRAIENRSTISNIGSTLCDNINVNYPRQPKNNNLYYISHTERKSEFRLYIFFPSFFINKLLIGYFFFFCIALPVPPGHFCLLLFASNYMPGTVGPALFYRNEMIGTMKSGNRINYRISFGKSRMNSMAWLKAINRIALNIELVLG